MDWRKRGIGIVLGAIIVVAGVGVLMSPIGINPPPVSFSWGIDVGDQFLFNITATGINLTTHYLAPLVNTSICVTVVSLSNDSVFSEEDFRSLVYSDKVECMFSNGSEIPYQLNFDISKVVSKFILPIGNWEYIDWLYPDSIAEVTDDPGNEVISTHMSKTNEDSFFFGYIANIIDEFSSGSGWSGNVSLSNGVPLSMEKWTFSFDDPNFFTGILRLQMSAES